MRVFLPLTWSMLAALAATGATAAALPAYAVTTAVRDALPMADEDELDYAALLAAGEHCLALLAAAPAEPARRIVVVAVLDDQDVQPEAAQRPGAVQVGAPVALTRITAVFVDEPAAVPAVRTAIDRLRGPGDQVEQTLQEHELLWYAGQEIADLLAGL